MIMEEETPKKKPGRPRMDSGTQKTSQITPTAPKKRPRITHIHPSRKAALTVRQEAFVAAYLKHGNATQAYRDAYSTANMNENTINRNGFEVLHSNKIAARIKEVEDKATANMVYGLKEHLAELEEAKAYALKRKSVSSVVRCTELKGRATGVYKEKVELTGANGGPIQLQPVPAFDLSVYNEAEIEQLYYLLGKQSHKEP